MPTSWQSISGPRDGERRCFRTARRTLSRTSETDLACGGGQAIRRRHDAGPDHGANGTGQPRQVLRCQIRKIPLQQNHIVGEQLSQRRVQHRAPHRIKHRRKLAETVSSQVELKPLILASFAGQFISQRQDERNSGRCFQRGVVGDERGRDAMTQSNDPVVHRIAPYQRFRPDDLYRGGGHPADRQPIKLPQPGLRGKPPVRQLPRRHIEDGMKPAAPDFKLLRRR